MDQTLLMNFAVAMTAMLNPIGKVPAWLRCIRGQSEGADRRTAGLVILTAAAILYAALWGGTALLSLFNIDLSSFRVAGSLVLLYAGWTMLRGEAVDVDLDADDEDSDQHGDDYAQAKTRFRRIVTPMAIPLIAGPGSITTVMVYADKVHGVAELLSLSGVLALLLTATAGILLAAPWIQRLLGELALSVITRLAGLLVIAIAMQLLLEGLGQVYPNWVSAASPLADDGAITEFR